MRARSITLLIGAVAVTGCATLPRVQGVEAAGPPPLRVWIGFPIGSSRVHPIFTNRDAHVAMFEIIPGRGVTMVYPYTRQDGLASDAHYADLTLHPGRMFYYTDPFGHASYQPRYYYAVASAAPLNLTRLQASLGATRRLLGQMYASYRPYDVIDRLTETIVPMQTDEDWATDLFVDWPTPHMPRFASYRLVQCANGRVIEVASNYPYYGCPGDAELAVMTTEPKTPPKEVELDAPRAPRSGTGREGIEYSDRTGDKRRRAEAGAQPPRTREPARARSGEIRYSDDRQPARSREASRDASRGASSQGAAPTGGSSTSESTGSSQGADRSQPTSKPERQGGESGKARKP